MQVYANSNRDSFKTILFFILVLIVAFLPISSFLFFIKNDAFNGYFPPKFFMSESLHVGQLPFWNPYINYGIPQYGDMSSGYWSPITWIVAGTVGYNAYTFTIEILFYILLGGVGMYHLTRLWITDKHIRILAAIAFMCCGYNVGHLQHFNWLSGTAFLPWCLFWYISLLRQFLIRNVIITAIVFYFFLSSAHPGIIISAFYFFVAVFLFHCFSNGNRIKKNCIQLAKSHLLFLLFLGILSAGMIAGYADMLPHFVRGEKISLQQSLSEPSTFQSWISVILPFATVKNDAFFGTDPSMRNSYFSITLLLFLLLSIFQKKTNWQIFLLLIGIGFMLLSTGGIFKTVAYKAMPFIGYVRLNGEFRIFTILAFVLVAAIQLDNDIRNRKTFSGPIKWIYYTVEVLIIGAIIYGVYKSSVTGDTFLVKENAGEVPGLSMKLKSFIDQISFYDTLWMQGSLQLLFLWGIKFFIKKQDWKSLSKLTVVNMIIITLCNLPFTGVGKASVADVQSVLNRSPKGLPAPPLHPIYNNDSLSPAESGLTGNWSFYNKQIGVIKEAPYPIILKNMSAYFNQNDQYKSAFLKKPYIFLSPDAGNIKVSFKPARITIAINSDSDAKITLQQNNYPHWFYTNSKNKNLVEPVGVNFMSAPVKKGSSEITFFFEPLIVKWMMAFSAISFLIGLILLYKLRPRSPFPS